MASTENALVEALSIVGDRWTLLIVDALREGPARFGDLGERVEPIAPNILSARLKHLEREGLVVARPYSRKPLRVTYELTGAGHDLAGALRLLAHWGARRTGSEAPRHVLCGTPMGARWYCPTCDRAVDDDEGAQLHVV